MIYHFLLSFPFDTFQTLNYILGLLLRPDATLEILLLLLHDHFLEFLFVIKYLTSSHLRRVNSRMDNLLALACN